MDIFCLNKHHSSFLKSVKSEYTDVIHNFLDSDRFKLVGATTLSSDVLITDVLQEHYLVQ